MTDSRLEESSQENPVAGETAVPSSRPVESAPVLQYARPMDPEPTREVTIARVATGAEAEMISGQLGAAGIPSHIQDRNVEVLGPYAAGSSVKVVVMAGDFDWATEVLRDEVEPAGESNRPLDDAGQPVVLAEVASFDQPRLLRQAAATLAAAHISTYLPTLIPRSQSTPGEGKRFVLRVEADELERAHSLLEERDEDGDDGPEPHCPKCHAWRVHKNTSMLEEIIRFFGLGRGRPYEYECLNCRHHGPEAEFLPARK